jgi:hypothetical protein
MKVELTDNDIREIKTAVRDRAERLKKEADKLVSLDRHAESENLAATARDLNERLCTHLASALGETE